MCTNKYIYVYNQIAMPYSSTTLQQEYFDSSISNLITTCAADAVHLEEESTHENTTQHMATLNPLQTQTCSLHSASPWLLLYLEVQDYLPLQPMQKQWHGHLDRLTEKHLRLLFLLLLYFLAFLCISVPQWECTVCVLCYHQRFLEPAAIWYISNILTMWNFTLSAITTKTYLLKAKA